MTKAFEVPVAFECRGDTLVGVAHVPAAAVAETALVIVVGGPQVRAGSHRQFVQLARAACEAGHAVLRFDARGRGDSSGEAATFEHLNDDIAAAIDEVLRVAPQARGVALWGLCDGASAALLYWHDTRDARVRALGLANPWVRSDASLARTHLKHYYGQRLLERAFWAKLLRGGVGLPALRGLLRSAVQSRGTGAAPAGIGFQDRMARAWLAFDGKMLLLLSGSDYTAREFVEHARMAPAWAGALARAGLERCDLADADHTFSADAERAAMERATVRWLADPRHADPRESDARRGTVLMEHEHG